MRIVWRCISRLEYGKKYCQNSPTMDEYKIHNAILQAINTITENREEILETVAEAIRTAFDAKGNNMGMAELKWQWENLNVVINNMIEQICNGESSNPNLDKELLEKSIEKEKLEAAIRAKALENKAAECENERLREVLAIIQQTPCALTEYDDMLVRKIVERVTVDNAQQVTVSFGYGVNIQVMI